MCPAGRVGLAAWLAALLACALPPAFAQADAAGAPPAVTTAELPQPEQPGPGFDGPVIGTRIGPGLTVGGYGTLQLIVPGLGTSQKAALPPGASPTGWHPGARQGQSSAQGVGSVPGKPFSDAQAASRSRLSISHLSAMLWWEPSPVWKLLAEVDSQDVVQLPAHESGRDGDNSSPYVALERLYVEHRASDAFSLRVGKFLTPIGRWNQDHPDPLTWTTLRPLISQSAFPTNATGVMAFGSLPGGLGADWQAFASAGSNWRSGPRTDPFTRAGGVRVVLPLSPEFQLGASAARYKQLDAHDDRRRLVGLDAVWAGRGGELSAEIIERRGPDGAPDDQERGWFVQAVVPLAPRLHGVMRIEAYRRAYTSDSTRTALVGVVWRSGRHWVFKAEWVRATPSNMGLAQGLLASMTALF
ncbi:hypothetical protein AACH10_02970 [Ideonella sp. DXS22W]|uniref:Uncharacterized protein n=1 Tax=Pseudaquabacterium inlustre TaxID=2984192 RepID=A0ABU9CFB3_9BURK